MVFALTRHSRSWREAQREYGLHNVLRIGDLEFRALEAHIYGPRKESEVLFRGRVGLLRHKILSLPVSALRRVSETEFRLAALSDQEDAELAERLKR